MMTALSSAQKYVVLAMCMLSQCVTCGTVSILGAFTENFLEAFPVNNASVAVTAAIAQSLFCGAGPVSLFFVGRLGYRMCVISAGILCCSCFVAASFVTQQFLWITLLLGICLGLMVNLTYFSTVVVLPEFFSEHRERKVAYGVMAIGAGLGFLLFPLIVTYLQAQYHWRQAMQLVGAISLHTVPLGAALPNRGVAQQEQLKGNSTESVVSSVKHRPQGSEFIQEKRSDRLALWTNPFLYATFLAFLLGYGAIAAFYTFVFVSFEQDGLSRSDAAFTLLLMGGVSVPSRIVYAVVCPWITIPSHIQWCAAVSLCNFALGCVTCFSTTWSIAVVAACVGGITYGLMWPVHPLVIADLFRHKHFPLMLSLTFFMLGVGGLIGPLIAGWIVDTVHDYWVALSGLGFFAFGLLAIPVASGSYHHYVNKRTFRIE